MVPSVFLGGKYGKHLNISSVCSPSCCLASLQAFLFSPFHLCLVSVASKVYFCLGTVNFLAPSTSDLKQMFQEARAFFIWFLIQIYSLFSHLAYSFAASGYHFSLNLYLLSVLQVGRIKFWRIVATNKKDFFKTSHNSNFSNSLKRCQLQFGWKLSHPQLSFFRNQSVGYSHNFTQTVPAQTWNVH